MNRICLRTIYVMRSTAVVMNGFEMLFLFGFSVDRVVSYFAIGLYLPFFTFIISGLLPKINWQNVHNLQICFVKNAEVVQNDENRVDKTKEIC